jgi:predicted ATP-dependent endonuclease of OLD family
VGSREAFENYVLLIDDPGVYLHILGQRDLLQTLERIAKKNQIIYVTHSPFLIDCDYLERNRIFEKEGVVEPKSIVDFKNLSQMLLHLFAMLLE